MALNSSGPISLGGATTGQSINLELGQAATANTSLNATNVRTLLQVPSGTISLQNAYGKSSNAYWIVYLGRARSSTQSNNTVIAGTNNAAHTAPSGITAVQMTVPGSGGLQTVRFTYIGNDGTVLSSSNFSGSSTSFSAFIPPATTNSSTTQFPVILNNGYHNVINSSYNVAYGNSGYFTPLGTNYSMKRGTLGSDNSFASVGMVNAGKSGFRMYFAKFNSGGSLVNLRYFLHRNFSDQSSLLPGIYVRSDNSYLASYYDTRQVLTSLTSSLGNTAQYYEVTPPATSPGGGGVVNLVDNTFWFLTNDQVCKVDASLTSAQYWSFSGRKPGVGASGRPWGFAIYSGILYFGCSFDSGGSTGDTPSFTIHAWTMASGTFLWSKNFQFNTSSQYSPFTSVQGTSLYANANGLFITTYANENYSTNQAFLIKVPLTGPANATYSNVAPGNSLTISTRTMSVTGSGSLTVTQQNNMSMENATGGATATLTPASSTALSITTTALT